MTKKAWLRRTNLLILLTIFSHRPLMGAVLDEFANQQIDRQLRKFGNGRETEGIFHSSRTEEAGFDAERQADFCSNGAVQIGLISEWVARKAKDHGYYIRAFPPEPSYDGTCAWSIGIFPRGCK